MKDGIYYARANGGTTYFVLNEKILMRLMGETYKVTMSDIRFDDTHAVADKIYCTVEKLFAEIKEKDNK